MYCMTYNTFVLICYIYIICVLFVLLNRYFRRCIEETRRRESQVSHCPVSFIHYNVFLFFMFIGRAVLQQTIELDQVQSEIVKLGGGSSQPGRIVMTTENI